jgi:hypothetical protein
MHSFGTVIALCTVFGSYFQAITWILDDLRNFISQKIQVVSETPPERTMRNSCLLSRPPMYRRETAKTPTEGHVAKLVFVINIKRFVRR